MGPVMKKNIEQFLNLNPNGGIFYHGSVSREEIPSVLIKT